MREFLYKIKHFITRKIPQFFKRNIFFFSKQYILKRLYYVAKSDSYYPELKRKSLFQRYFDLLKWYKKYKEVADFYNLYGLDVKGKDIFNNNFINYFGLNGFAVTRDQNNKNNINLRNKFLFFKILSEASINTPFVFEKIKPDTQEDINNLYRRYSDKDVFVKSLTGECADGVYHLKPNCDKPSIPRGGGENTSFRKDYISMML